MPTDANRPPLGDRAKFDEWYETGCPHQNFWHCEDCLYAAFVALAADAERLDWLETAEGQVLAPPLRNIRADIDAARAAKENPTDGEQG